MPFCHTKTCTGNTQGFFFVVKIENFIDKKNILHMFAQNIACGYTLEPPRRGGSNVYPQSMFWSENKKNMYTLVYPNFANITVGYTEDICFFEVNTKYISSSELKTSECFQLTR